MIPRIAIHRSSSSISLSQFNPEQNEPVTTKPSVETHGEQKGAIRALRKWVNKKSRAQIREVVSWKEEVRFHATYFPADRVCYSG